MLNKYNNHANNTKNNNNKIDKLWMILLMIWEHKVQYRKMDNNNKIQKVIKIK